MVPSKGPNLRGTDGTMQLRTQLAVVGVVAAGWSAGNIAVVSPVVDGARGGRGRLAALESTIARDPSDVIAMRRLAAEYLDRDMPELLIETAARLGPTVQQDGRVALLVARAHARCGGLYAAAAMLNGAMARCSALPSVL